MKKLPAWEQPKQYETHGVLSPEVMQWLPDTMRELLSEAVKHHKDIEFLCSHREDGTWEMRIRLVEEGRHVFKMPPFRLVGEDGRTVAIVEADSE